MKCNVKKFQATTENIIDCTLYAGILSYAEVYGIQNKAIKNIINDVIAICDEYHDKTDGYGHEIAIRREVEGYNLGIDYEKICNNIFNYIHFGQITFMLDCFIVSLAKKKKGKEKIKQFAKMYIGEINKHNQLTSQVAKALHDEIKEKYKLNII